MGLFDILWSLAVLLASLLYPAGWEMVNRRQFNGAALSFWAGALFLAGVAVMWGKYTGLDLGSRLLISGLVGAVTLIGLTESIRYLTTARAQSLLAEHSRAVPPTTQMKSISGNGSALVSGNNTGTVIGTQNNYYGRVQDKKKVRRPKIIFPKYSLFWVEMNPGIYQLGMVIKLFNSDNQAYVINGISYSSATYQMVGRGSWWVKELALWPSEGQSIEDRYIKAGNEGYYKILIPTAVKLTPANGTPENSGPPTGYIIRAKWSFVFGDQHLSVEPEFAATYDHLITAVDWSSLTRPNSKINVETLDYAPL